MGEKEKGLKFIEEAIERENTPVDMESLIKEAKITFPDAEVTIISSGPGKARDIKIDGPKGSSIFSLSIVHCPLTA